MDLCFMEGIRLKKRAVTLHLIWAGELTPKDMDGRAHAPTGTLLAAAIESTAKDSGLGNRFISY